MSVLDVVNEKTTQILQIAFFDQDGGPVVPDSATYRIDAVREGVAVKASTAITGLASVVDLEVTSAQNAALSSAPFSERVVTIEFVYTGTKRGTTEYRYLLKNLYGVS